jgi:hypothetical protein
VKVSPDGSQIAIVYDDGIEVRPATELGRSRPDVVQVVDATSVAFSKDGYLLAVLDSNGQVSVHGVLAKQKLMELPQVEGQIVELVFSASNSLLALCRDGQKLYVRDLQCEQAASCTLGATHCHGRS